MSLSEIESIKINEEQMLLATSQVIQIKGSLSMETQGLCLRPSLGDYIGF